MLLGAGITALILFLLRKIAFRIDLLDRPDSRKQHQGAIPLVGGLGIYAGFVLTGLLLGIPLYDYAALIVGGLILVAVGLVDDLHELPPQARFVAQAIAALLMIYWGGVELTDLGYLLPGIDHPVKLAWLCVPFTVFATIGVINALNMVDGVDGLAGSVVLNALLAWLSHDLADVSVLLLLASAVMAFLGFNWRFKLDKKPLMFLGDAGSLLLGFVLTWFMIKLSQGEHRAMAPTTAPWLVAIPLIDTIVMMVRRIRKGRSPFTADREHFHHVLQYAGFNRRETVFIILGASVVFSAIGIAGELQRVPEPVMLAAFLAVFATYYALIMRSWRMMRFLKRSICRRHKHDRRQLQDRRQQQIPWVGPERRQLADRRQTLDRRTSGDTAPSSPTPSAPQSTGKKVGALR
ncbi:UDP-GlcNAc:undecaprenyl-phosphate GlcNAc-1-phosphate transferase [endosymbiont of unidentified scaly snail isolate Monju]|nr:UDP-GlcNAc:undecaprenyl-phosphate GlcNAc-1-phosphate transferase [endosymbiont of unidentified scaly snail isolate Monju]